MPTGSGYDRFGVANLVADGPVPARDPLESRRDPLELALARHQSSHSAETLFPLLKQLAERGDTQLVVSAIQSLFQRREAGEEEMVLSRVDIANLECMLADAELKLLRAGAGSQRAVELQSDFIDDEWSFDDSEPVPLLQPSPRSRPAAADRRAAAAMRFSASSPAKKPRGGSPVRKSGGGGSAKAMRWAGASPHMPQPSSLPPPGAFGGGMIRPAPPEAPPLLESLLRLVPGLGSEQPANLLGLRPLQRSEVVARVLRCECTVWEAREAYQDSHMLYLRQRLALLLQAQWRRRQAQFEVWERRVGGKMRHALNFWRMRLVTSVFDGWRGVVDDSKRAWATALTAASRLSNHGLGRAFNTWSGHMRARRAALVTLAASLGGWVRRREARAFRQWTDMAAARLVALLQLKRAVAAMAQRPVRQALNGWCAHVEQTLRMQRRLRGALGGWTDRAAANAFRTWKANAPPRKRRGTRSGGGRGGGMDAEEMAEMMAMGCWKKGRRSSSWRRVQPVLEDGYFTYAKGRGLRTLKNPGVAYGWVAAVRPVGATAVGCLFRSRRWDWAVQLNPAGRKATGVAYLSFRSASPDAMMAWISAISSEVNGAPLGPPSSNKRSLGGGGGGGGGDRGGGDRGGGGGTGHRQPRMGGTKSDAAGRAPPDASPPPPRRRSWSPKRRGWREQREQDEEDEQPPQPPQPQQEEPQEPQERQQEERRQERQQRRYDEEEGEGDDYYEDEGYYEGEGDERGGRGRRRRGGVGDFLQRRAARREERRDAKRERRDAKSPPREKRRKSPRRQRSPRREKSPRRGEKSPRRRFSPMRRRSKARDRGDDRGGDDRGDADDYFDAAPPLETPRDAPGPASSRRKRSLNPMSLMRRRGSSPKKSSGRDRDRDRNRDRDDDDDRGLGKRRPSTRAAPAPESTPVTPEPRRRRGMDAAAGVPSVAFADEPTPAREAARAPAPAASAPAYATDWSELSVTVRRGATGSLGINLTPENLIIDVTPGTPAAGRLLVNDRVVGIDGERLRGRPAHGVLRPAPTHTFLVRRRNPTAATGPEA